MLYRVVYGQPMLDGMSSRVRDLVAACLTKDPSARPPLAALASIIGAA